MAKRKTLDADGIWRPKKVKIVFTDEKLTASAGLGPLVDAFTQSPQYEKLKKIIPQRKSNASYDSMQFVLALMSGFWEGYDCLEDIEKFEDNPDIYCRLEGLPSARAIGDYLRSFTEEDIDKLNGFLTEQGFNARLALAPDSPIILDQDSTAHPQSGDKIEGLEQNYKGQWCLDSLDSYDELGFAYGFKLRSGATFSSISAEEEIKRIFSRLKHSDKKYYRADSAFCNERVIRECLNQGAFFTITAHDNINWKDKAKEITNWEPWVYSEEDLKKAEKRKKKLPEVECGSFLYQPGWSENLRFYIMVKRTKKEPNEQTTLFEFDEWKYWGVMTNWNTWKHSKQEILMFHQKRGNTENFIKEQKISYDLKHFPCQKLNANWAYGLIAQIAHNFLRIIARLDNPDKPHFAKKIRGNFVHIPGKLILNQARYTVLKIPRVFMKEVMLMTTGWAGTLQAALNTGEVLVVKSSLFEN